MWLISYQTLLELSQLGSWKDDVERRRWEKTFHVLKLFNNTTKAWEVSTWQTYCYHCIKHQARQSAGTKRFWHLIHMAKINAGILYRRHFCQNGKPHKNHKSLLQFSLELSDALIFANKVNPSSSSGRPQNEEVWRHLPRVAPTTYSSIAFHRCSFWSSRTLAKRYYQQKSMQIMQYDLQNAMSQM